MLNLNCMKNYHRIKKLSFVLSIFLIGTALLGSCQIFGKAPSGDSYFVHREGNDRNDGLSQETPFRSLFKAMAMAVNTPIKTITVMGTLDAQSEQSTNRERVFLIQGMNSEPVLIRGKNSGEDPAVLSAVSKVYELTFSATCLPATYQTCSV